jgi:hypothetical protein
MRKHHGPNVVHARARAAAMLEELQRQVSMERAKMTSVEALVAKLMLEKRSLLSILKQVRVCVCVRVL